MRINLKDIFGVDFSGRTDIRDAIAQALMDRIIERTKNSKDIKDSSFKSYLASYKESDAFKAASKSGKVNLTLSGDMLGLMDVVEETTNTVTLGWADSEEKAKAHGHINGIKSKKGPRVRDFFGLSPKDLKAVKSEYEGEIKDLIKSKRTEGKKKFQAAVTAFLERTKPDGDS